MPNDAVSRRLSIWNPKAGRRQANGARVRASERYSRRSARPVFTTGAGGRPRKQATAQRRPISSPSPSPSSSPWRRLCSGCRHNDDTQPAAPLRELAARPAFVWTQIISTRSGMRDNNTRATRPRSSAFKASSHPPPGRAARADQLGASGTCRRRLAAAQSWKEPAGRAGSSWPFQIGLIVRA
jgi:hypothetical protein